jgi:phosphomannomutase/phosphoglucomutase
MERRSEVQPANRSDPPPKVSPRLFGTSGIRCENEDLTSEIAEKLGRTFAMYLDGRGTVLVGRDVRLHSKRIQTALIRGLLTGGVDVDDCGVAPTPALLFALKETHASAGVIVSGSHTPPEIAGILFFLGDTGEMDPTGEKEFETIYHSQPWRESPPENKGSVRSTEVLELYLREISMLLGNIGGYKVVVDPGNGATCATLARALDALGCSVTTINGEPNGRFPSRPPNPQPSTLTQLSSAVEEAQADLGVGTDSDGDRALFATPNGRVLWGDIAGALFAQNELQKLGGGTIITTVNTSNIVKLVCQERGGRLIVTKVGPPAIAQALRSNQRIIFATEESGKHIWPEIILYGDAALATGKLLQIMSARGLGLESLVETLPKFYQLKSTLECPDDLKAKVMKLVADEWGGDEQVHTSTLDGLKAEYPDLTWFLVRASGTEPVVRCSAEGKSMDDARKLLTKATELARFAINKAKEGRQE